ncbi:Wzz/FepE/Etk N-terminal domain-containing protein [Photobacterium sagamiensis]|uniref:Wzz/FepE/Etk N-terminal domain-containing protein n=1 Tax=Photobacterium sagamiensis TaxID=2910241 RepID=UPI003D138850
MPSPLSTQMTAFAPPPADDEIDLKELIIALWKGKWLIIATTFLFAVAGVLFALSQPNIYKSDILLAPANAEGKGGLSAMAAQFGGLASLAGVNLGGGGTDKTKIALATLKSRQFISAFIHEHDLLVPLLAATEWDKMQDVLAIDPGLYDTETQQWVREVQPGQSVIPTDWEAYKAFSKLLAVSEDKKSGLVTISVEHYSAVLAQQWLTWLVQDINLWTKRQSSLETERNIAYLEQQLQKTTIADMQSVFYQLIEDQTKNQMLAEVSDEYSFKVIDPAVVFEEKAKPKRALICVLAILLGGMLGVAIVLIRHAFRRKEE